MQANESVNPQGLKKHRELASLVPKCVAGPACLACAPAPASWQNQSAPKRLPNMSAHATMPPAINC